MVEGRDQDNLAERVNTAGSDSTRGPHEAGSAADLHMAFLDDAGFKPRTTGGSTQASETDPSSEKSAEKKTDNAEVGPGSDNKEPDKIDSDKADPLKEAIRMFEDEVKEMEIAGIKQFLIDADAAHRKHDKETGKESDWAEFYTKMLAQKTGGMSAEDQKALVDLFKAAGDAHEKFEEETGEEDKDWPDWYARYIHARKSPTQTLR
ncbi:MAG: hypothetical protein K2X77_09875 [Candidatus Obscuribacterales bacterium]|jgi:hypothetical protein|nr:hypothetical protein [Candidatus Obscuribacterales bacterium]